jgi:hypothetical protein
MDGEITAPRENEAREVYWRRVLQQWKESGLRACEFQRQNNLNKQAFIYWKLKLIGTDARITLVPVRIGSTARGMAFAGGIRLRVGELFTVEVMPGFDTQTLRQLLGVVREQAG